MCQCLSYGKKSLRKCPYFSLTMAGYTFYNRRGLNAHEVPEFLSRSPQWVREQIKSNAFSAWKVNKNWYIPLCGIVIYVLKNKRGSARGGRSGGPDFCIN